MKFSRVLIKDGTYPLDKTNHALLIIIFLHHNKVITDEKLKGMFHQLRKGKLLRFVNTFYWKPGDMWYNEESMSEILADVYGRTFIKDNEIDLDTMLKYLNLYLNANKNFCLNYIYYNFILPSIDKVSSTYNYISSFGVDVSNVFKITTWEYENCYVCGSSHEYRVPDYKGMTKELKNIFIQKINSYKVGRWELAPNQLEI